MGAHVMFEKMNQPTRFLAFEFCCSARRLASHKACSFVFPTTDVGPPAIEKVGGFISDIPTSELHRNELSSTCVLPLKPDIKFYSRTKHSKSHCCCTLKGGNSAVILEYFQVFAHSKRFLSLRLYEFYFIHAVHFHLNRLTSLI
jgi:hypothetical protein